jgi:hypothetical protein
LAVDETVAPGIRPKRKGASSGRRASLRVRLFGALLSVIAACSVTAPTHAQALFDRRPLVIDDPHPARFSVCFSHSCSIVVTVALSSEDWQRVRIAFGNPVGTPEEERARLADAIALMESMVGGRTGTWRDFGGDLKGFARPGQMDCVDEANNTTTYLKMFAADGLLKWHTVWPILKRGHIFRGVPHATAVIVDTTNGDRWAVDSWYQDNGMPPYIVPYHVWYDGWSPPKE